jgi:endoglycosylceramidase
MLWFRLRAFYADEFFDPVIMRSRIREVLCTVAASMVFVLAGCGGSGAAASSTSAANGAAVAQGELTSPITRTGKYLTDNQGRVVVFHGVNIIRKLSPYWPSTLSSADASLLADEGFNAARIGWIWAGAEPTPGNYDDAYLNQLLGFNALLGSYGIRSFVDFHQDSWSQSAGGDGAPAWATLGQSSGSDWEDFWNDAPAADGVGIQTRFRALWGHAAALIDAAPSAWNIVGIDPLNEPNPGNGYSTQCVDDAACPAFEKGPLAAFYVRAIAAIRGAGNRHVIFPESGPQHVEFQPAIPDLGDAQTAYSWHYYCLLTELTSDPDGIFDAYCDPLTKQALGNESAYGDKMDVPELIGEFGANGADAAYAKQVDAMDAYFFSWTYWTYYAMPGDPADFAAGSILLDSTQPGSESNANQTKLDALVVPYPQAIAGTPGSYDFDRSTGTMQLDYSTTPVPGATLANGALTRIFVPRRQYPAGYQVEAVGATVVSAPGAPWVELRAAPGTASVEVTILPATGGSTELPSQTGVFPLAVPG